MIVVNGMIIAPTCRLLVRRTHLNWEPGTDLGFAIGLVGMSMSLWRGRNCARIEH